VPRKPAKLGKARKGQGPRKGQGLGYPPQPCGLSYKDFRAGWAFRDADEHVAWARGEGPRTITQRTVLRELAKLKRLEYERYQDDCSLGSRRGASSAKKYTDCDKICRAKSQPCGRGCITKKKTCRKPVAERICSIDEFQLPIDWDPAPRYEASEFADDWLSGLRRAKRKRKR
jgi:hypothetical protein